ncbi:MAG: guanylate kinase [Candidatus Krumholzibacteria bacterium]
MTKAFPIVISGPSGVGKTTLVNGIIARDPQLRESVSATTRPPRDGEVEGESYVFVSDKQFDKLKRGKLIEWAEVHDHLYGTPREFVEGELAKGLDVVLNIDVQGGASVKKCFPEAVLIFILPPSFKVLDGRVRGRGTDYAKEIKKRMKNARREVTFAPAYDYIVVNDQMEDAVSALRAIIESERRRQTRYPEDYFDRFGR